MSARKVIAASAAALALVAMSVPVVNAQNDAPESGSLSLGGLVGGSLDEGSLAGDSAGSSQDEGEGDSAEGASDSAGGLQSLGSEGDSLSGLGSQGEEICELPGLGGSVAKFYPLFGITGVPTGVIDIVTTALDNFPNLLEMVAGEGAGAALLWQAGSLNEGLCTSVFGGEMVMPPETVYVDEDGQPVSTVTGTPAPGAGSSGSGGSAVSETAKTSGGSLSEQGAEQGAEQGSEEESEISAPDGAATKPALSTTVPVP